MKILVTVIIAVCVIAFLLWRCYRSLTTFTPPKERDLLELLQPYLQPEEAQFVKDLFDKYEVQHDPYAPDYKIRDMIMDLCPRLTPEENSRAQEIARKLPYMEVYYPGNIGENSEELQDMLAKDLNSSPVDQSTDEMTSGR